MSERLGPQQLATARSIYNAAVAAGASPTLASYLAGSAYQESGFDPFQSGSDGGTSQGLFQVNPALYSQWARQGVNMADPAAQTTAYVQQLQKMSPDTFAAMNAATSPQDVYAVQHQDPNFAMGIPGGRFDYAAQLQQAISQDQQSQFGGGAQPGLSPFEQAFNNWQPGDISPTNFNTGGSPESFVNPQDFGVPQPQGTGGIPWEPPSYSPGQISAPQGDHSQVPFADLSGFTPQGQFTNIPTNEGSTFNPVNDFSFQPQNVPTNENVSPDLTGFQPWNIPTNEEMFPTETGFAPQNVPTFEEMFPSETGFQPQNIPTDETMVPSETGFQPLDATASGSASIGDPGATASTSGQASVGDPFAGVQGGATIGSGQQQGSTPYQPPAYDPLSQGSIGQPGGVQSIPSVDPSTGLSFNPQTGTYSGGWQNTGYGAGSPYGAGSAGYGGAGFGGYGGLGGTGAPVTGHVGDAGSSSDISHGGVDPSSDPSGGPTRAMALPEGGGTGSDIMDMRIAKQLTARGYDPTVYQDQLDAKLQAQAAAAPQQYPTAWSWWKNPFPQGGSSQRGGGLGSSWIQGTGFQAQPYQSGAWQPTAWTTNPALQVAMPGSGAPQAPQTPETPPTGLEMGGLVHGHDFGYDTVPAILRPKEVVLNEDEQANVKQIGHLPHEIASQLYKARLKKAA